MCAKREYLFTIDDEVTAAPPCNCVHIVAGVAGTGFCVTNASNSFPAAICAKSFSP